MNKTVFKRKIIRQENIDAVKVIEGDLNGSRAVVFTGFSGLTVSDMNELRQSLSAALVKYKVVKNTLARIAASNANLSITQEFLEGPTAVAYGKSDPVIPAKILSEFAKKNNKLTIKGGVLNGKVVSIKDIQALAKLPGRKELLTLLVSVLVGPIRGLVTVLGGNIRNFARVLDEIRKQKDK